MNALQEELQSAIAQSAGSLKVGAGNSIGAPELDRVGEAGQARIFRGNGLLPIGLARR
jgi:hypothetical protein